MDRSKVQSAIEHRRLANERGEHYDETYAPVASWNSVPAGMELEDGSNPNDFVLKIHRNIYGQKQAGRVWNQYLVRKLVKDLGFQQSAVDECVFYRGSTLSIIGKLNYLEKATRSDIAYAVHQCARFVSDPKKEHGDAVRWLGRYCWEPETKAIMQPMTNKDLEVFVDASFCGDWDPKEAASDRDTARSRHGYIIKYANCPLLWKSQLQTEVALSSTESEYTGLSYALRDAIPIMELLKEMKERGYPVSTTQAQVHCRVFEDNSGALKWLVSTSIDLGRSI
ncbi:hypothetical protein MHU86_2180 [Fragilaria crotonensis]|nr:hypothetical protein MHU86_2180 [Fragilaria crotonensis]